MIRIISDESTVKATFMSRLQCLRDVVLALGQDIEVLANAQLGCCPSPLMCAFRLGNAGEANGNYEYIGTTLNDGRVYARDDFGGTVAGGTLFGGGHIIHIFDGVTQFYWVCGYSTDWFMTGVETIYFRQVGNETVLEDLPTLQDVSSWINDSDEPTTPSFTHRVYCPTSSSSSSSSSGTIEDNMLFGDGNPVEWSE